MRFANPVIQAPLAGGGDTPALVSAVCNAGALGFIGAAYLSPAQIAEAARSIRERTPRPFGINLFIPWDAPPVVDPAKALAKVAPYFAELGLPAPVAPTDGSHNFDAQLKAALDCGAEYFSFTFGPLPDDAVRAIKAQGMYLMGTATTPEEAVALERNGVNAVIAQGVEAGGHHAGPGLIPTMDLIAQIKLPVIASGGITDVKAALATGAIAVQMGTVFLTSDESGVSEAYKEAILNGGETRITRAFSGRPARGIVNRFMNEVGEDDILPWPLQNTLTRPLRIAAAKQGRAEFLSLWAGQGLQIARRGPASEVVRRLTS